MEKVTESEKEKKNNWESTDFTPNARYLAVKLLNRYDRSDSYIDRLLLNSLKNENLIQQEKALLTELVNGVIRWRGKLDWILTGFYHGDYQKCLNLVKNAMRIAIYQIMFLNRIPVPAAIYESVEIVKRIQGEKTAGIVNGVLRNIARNLDNIRYPDRSEDEIYFYAVLHSHPKWMVKRWLERYGLNETIMLMEYFNTRPYIPVRVNSLKSDLSEIAGIFEKFDVNYKISPFNENTLILQSPKYDLTASEIFRTGKITIQDPSASIAVKFSAAKPGDFIIDLCAAPGGKSFLLADMMQNSGKIYSLDKHPSKLRFIQEGSERLGINIIQTVDADASGFQTDEKADIVFADVPCSGLGTISKKPDIKWKREYEDISSLVIMQRQILENAAKLVKEGGTILYSTCTIEPEENEENIKWFLNRHPEFEIDRAEKFLNPELCNNGFYRTIPYIHGMDGAFAAKLKRTT